MANFAPYQDVPETQRALSPPLPSHSPRPSPRASLDRPSRNIGTAAVTSPHSAGFSQRDYFAGQQPTPEPERERVAWNAPGGFGGGREDVDMFETRLGLRMDYEACLAYLLLPPAGGVLLLVLEHRSDYVRFHAWQSSLLFAFVFVVHIIFSWSSIISWLLFVGDIALIGFLTWHAYKDAETLDRYEVPFFGPLASSILDDE
ncbi:hypothetical protein BCR34DRAFT_239017 [Clohesyomyces aquaticus]|uniref:Uncharacterized protein n=1 Tax=Clohesyomyces aquaticus TaxID=1231657 RepID=A0A1Y1ZVU5_9PLEO|nr:hypothetical protein BCR34DRAFT_239017 [Clohesyomyces aquaticus]